MDKTQHANADYKHMLTSTKESRNTTEVRISKSGVRQVWHSLAFDAGHGLKTPGKRAK